MGSRGQGRAGPGRRRWWAVATAGIVVAGLAVAAPPSGAARASRPDTKIQYTPATVVVTSATVKAQLLSVSSNGATYTFRSATGVLGRLAKGSVMLLQDLAVRDVTGVTHHSGHLVVATKAAAITDLIENGTLSWDEPVDFAHGVAIGGAAVPPEADVARGPVTARLGLESIAHGVTLKGKADTYSYAVTFKTVGKGVSVEITLSKSKPIDLSVTISGTLGGLATSGDIAVANRKLSAMKLADSGLAGSFTLAYEAKPISALGLGSAGGVKITIPAELTVPFDVGGVPMFLGIKVAFIASAGFSGYNQSLKGSYTISYNGHGGFSTSSSGATSATGVIKGLGKIVLDAANAVKSGPMSFLFGAQFPQIELGLGVKGLNVGAFVTLLGESGIAFINSCDTREFLIEGTTGAEASFFGLSASLGSATLFSKTYQAAYPPGCGTFP
ncbi:MAG: hypothetical protein ABSE47_14100 [Acidimicrobiales bacterium]|jgi:hypothetical protein